MILSAEYLCNGGRVVQLALVCRCDRSAVDSRIGEYLQQRRRRALVTKILLPQQRGVQRASVMRTLAVLLQIPFESTSYDVGAAILLNVN